MSDIGALRWRCRRGARELDLLLRQYLDEHYERAEAEEQSAFRALLEMPDPELLTLLLGTRNTDDPALAKIITTIRSATR